LLKQKLQIELKRGDDMKKNVSFTGIGDHNLEQYEATPTVTSSSTHTAERKLEKEFKASATLISRPSVPLDGDDTQKFVFFPWNKYYKAWWGFTVSASVISIFTTTYQWAFVPAGLVSPDSALCIIEYILVSIFACDIGVNFNLVFYNEQDEIEYDRREIARRYFGLMFWIDFIGVFPFYVVALAISGELGQDSQKASYLALLQLIRLVRIHRVKQLFDILQYSSKISLMSLTLIRNFSAALVWTHLAACIMYFIARQFQFDAEETWIGGSLAGLNPYERYVTTLYWSVVTFTTVGYGDFSPVNSAEQIWGIIYMMMNIIWQSWFIGSITLLVVKSDEKTGLYRDTLQTLDQYSKMHNFDHGFHKRLKTQLKLDFNNREISDEHVLQNFPSSMRRKVLRRLYLPCLIHTSLMKGIRQRFVDAFLTTCSVEIFTPGERILKRGSISSDLYLLVEGVAKLVYFGENANINSSSAAADYSDSKAMPFGMMDSAADSYELNALDNTPSKRLRAGEFINEIGFFTDTPQIDTVRTVTVCKTLTMSRSAYKMISHDHPGSVRKILQNLLTKVEEMGQRSEPVPSVSLPKRFDVLRAGLEFDHSNSGNDSVRSGSQWQHTNQVRQSVASVQTQAALTAAQDLIKMHINKKKGDQTTRFLFAASQDDISTTTLMCDQGFDPNNADYDSRTALMVAAMKGNTDIVTALILENGANPNLLDAHGTSALYEAAKNGHDATMAELLKHEAKLGMDESQAASSLCHAVFHGDILMLRRLLEAQIQVNASDYDGRTAGHIAASEGNVAALRVMVEFGADLKLKDRWKNTVFDDAKRVNAGQLLDFLKTLEPS
jgi:ankyrin repeat protein/CRP-like cAMP-binding protein